MPRVTFLLPEGKKWKVEVNTSLLDASKVLGLPIEPRLRRQCLLHHLSGRSAMGAENLSEIDFDEQDLLGSGSPQ